MHTHTDTLRVNCVLSRTSTGGEPINLACAEGRVALQDNDNGKLLTIPALFLLIELDLYNAVVCLNLKKHDY